MKYINCKAYAQEILDKVKATKNKKELWIITVGDNAASESYVKGKIKDCIYCGIPYVHIKLPDDKSSKKELEACIRTANEYDLVGGVIIQLPLPTTFNEEYFTSLVSKEKDVDGFVHDSRFDPCTSEGIMYVLHKELGDLTGMNAVVIGRGKLVGKPVAQMLVDADCTVTILHTKTSQEAFRDAIRNADIIISAVGKPNFLDLMCCRAKVVIDVGINRNKEGKLCGDCYNFSSDSYSDTRVTPTPGGIGLMTRAMLMRHMIS